MNVEPFPGLPYFSFFNSRLLFSSWLLLRRHGDPDCAECQARKLERQLPPGQVAQEGQRRKPEPQRGARHKQQLVAHFSHECSNPKAPAATREGYEEELRSDWQQDGQRRQPRRHNAHDQRQPAALPPGLACAEV